MTISYPLSPYGARAKRIHAARRDLYPITVIADRYTGAYSGALWTAFNLRQGQIPEGVDDGDPECMEFWDNYTEPVGKGNTPDDAVRDLEAQIIA